MAKKSPAPSAALAVIDQTKPVDLAKLDGSQIRNVANFDANELAARAKAMLGHIDELDKERSQKGVLAGLYLQQVKLALPHGEFGKWKEKHLGNALSRTANNVMLLAEKFCRAAKLFLPELVASQQLSLSLEAPKGAAATFKQKLVKFVGKLGLTELYRRHGVIKRGGKRARRGPAAGVEPAASVSPGALAYQQMVDAVDAARADLLDDVRWSLLTPEVAAQVEPMVKKLASDFHNRLLQARHEAK